MVDLAALTSDSAADHADADHAVFTSLPSPTGEGYRLVAWSSGVKAEERAEITRRAPSHGSLCGEGASAGAVSILNLRSSGRTAFGFTRVSGAEHTRRGGGRVWTDFVVLDAAEASRAGLRPADVRGALPRDRVARPGTAVLPRLQVSLAGGAPLTSGATGVAVTVAATLADRRPSVIAVGKDGAALLCKALGLLPAGMRGGIEACGGLRFSRAREVVATVVDTIDQDTVRSTRGQGVECVDATRVSTAATSDLAPWLRLMARWCDEGRTEEAARLSDGLRTGWRLAEILEVAALCEAIDRREEKRETLDLLLSRRSAN
jgi:hypothetical protein